MLSASRTGAPRCERLSSASQSPGCLQAPGAVGRRGPAAYNPGPMAIYLDHAATTPLRPESLEAMLPYLTEQFGNPSSAHAFGRKARAALDEAHGAGARRGHG